MAQLPNPDQVKVNPIQKLTSTERKTLLKAIEAARTLVASLDLLQQLVAGAPGDRDCRLCAHYQHTDDQCAIWKMNIPSYAIEKGCDHWTDDIPF